MKEYIGTKTIQAEPMLKGEAYSKGLLRKDIYQDDDDIPGYCVMYKDGYESWSPADVFEEAYKLAETPVDRMEIERGELATKAYKLSRFMITKTFDNLDSVTKTMLKAQYSLMLDYQDILTMRMNRMQNGHQNITGVNFGIAIQMLKAGMIIRRSGWNGKDIVVFKQVPAQIGEAIVAKMQSLPGAAKTLILTNNKHIDYTSQCLIYNIKTGRADSWVPSISDVFAEDWELVI